MLTRERRTTGPPGGARHGAAERDSEQDEQGGSGSEDESTQGRRAEGDRSAREVPRRRRGRAEGSPQGAGPRRLDGDQGSRHRVEELAQELHEHAQDDLCRYREAAEGGDEGHAAEG